MRKLTWMVMLGLFLIGWGMEAAAQDEEFPLWFTPQANLVIDGSRADWPATVPCILESDSQIKRGTRQSRADFYVTTWLMFDAENLYVFAEIVDATPLKNTFRGGEMYQGDTLELYLGFREEAHTSYEANDFQVGIGLSEHGPIPWCWTTTSELMGTEIVIVPTSNGYTVEGRIPLSNFRVERVKAGDPIWFDVAADNNTGGAERQHQLVWYGDGEGWQNPEVWRKARLITDPQVMQAAYILTPPEFVIMKAHRVYFWHQGQPWQGAVTLGDHQLTTDERGGLDVQSDTKATLTIAANIGGMPLSTDIDIGAIKQRMAPVIITVPIKKIKVNQNGYLPGEAKSFILTDNEAMLAAQEFTIVNALMGGVEFTGALPAAALRDPMTDDLVYVGDFSAFTTPGLHLIRIKGIGDSHPFSISDTVFTKLFYTTMRSYFLQRCGVALDDAISGVKHALCHANDGVLKTAPEQALDVTGGWHDAGDYGKYMPTAGVTAAQLLMMYELAPQKFARVGLDIPESGGNLPDVLAEVKFELDWMLKMQAADGGVYHKVNTQNFPPAVLPERDKQPRFIYEVGTTDTGIFVGGMAVAARVFRMIDPAYADILQAAAIRSGAFLLQHKNDPPLWPSNDNTGAYKSDDASDEVFWGLAELFRLTGDAHYLDALLPLREPWLQFNDFGWENTSAFGMYALAQAEKTPDDVRSMLRDRIRQKAEQLTAHISSNGYRTALRADQFYWASNKVACALGVNLVLAYELLKNDAFKQAARAQVDYVLGVNTLSKSFVTDVGVDGVRYPHHRIVEAVGTLVPGLLVGGPNTHAEDKSYPQGLGPRGYRDLFASYASNENAIDYNAPLVFLAGYFMPY